MAYSDFKTLDQVNQELGIVIQGDNELYIHLDPVHKRHVIPLLLPLTFEPE